MVAPVRVHQRQVEGGRVDRLQLELVRLRLVRVQREVDYRIRRHLVPVLQRRLIKQWCY